MLGWPISHVKSHGSLNNPACTDRHMADTMARAIHAFDLALFLLLPALSELAAARAAVELPVALEVVADSTYEPDGQMPPCGARHGTA